jgi:hypothetical protein
MKPKSIPKPKVSDHYIRLYNYRGKVTNSNNHHGDKDSANLADETIVRRKKNEFVVWTVDLSPLGQAKLTKIDQIVFCRVKASSSNTFSTSTKNFKKKPKTLSQNIEK